MTMKTVLAFSLALNLMVALLAGGVLWKKGGWSFLRAKYVEYMVDSPYAEPGSPYHESTYYKTRLSQYVDLPGDHRSILLLGDSHIERGLWSEYLGTPVLNRGISGEQVGSLKWRMERMIASEPAQVVILSGANDARLGVNSDTVLASYAEMLQAIRERSPSTKITVLTIPPFGHGLPNSGPVNRRIQATNAGLYQLASAYEATVVDAAGAVTDDDGDLLLDYSYDHLHLNARGYRAVADVLAPHVARAFEASAAGVDAARVEADSRPLHRTAHRNQTRR